LTYGRSAITYRTGGTGFLIDSKGWLVTKAHVIQNAKNIAVQNSKGKDLNVEIAYVDAARDIAILKIVPIRPFKAAPLPYGIRHGSAKLPNRYLPWVSRVHDMVYGEGYLAAKTGFNGDTLTCQIAIAANPGNSGGPILNQNGEVIGILSTRQTTAEGVVFATQSRYIFDALKELQKDSLPVQKHKNTCCNQHQKPHQVRHGPGTAGKKDCRLRVPGKSQLSVLQVPKAFRVFALVHQLLQVFFYHRRIFFIRYTKPLRTCRQHFYHAVSVFYPLIGRARNQEFRFQIFGLCMKELFKFLLQVTKTAIG
jgi:hypothetical protein